MKFLDLAPHYEISKESIKKRIDIIFEHGRYIMGPEIDDLESALQKYTGAKHAVVCSNGTTALQIALMAIGIQPGDEVIVPAFTFFATAEAVSLLGAIPVFVDINPLDFNISVESIKEAITEKTKAVIPVSLFGQPADFDEINNLAKEYNLKIIEDAAQSFGSSLNGTKSCNLSELATTSFFPAKPLGAFGDAGAVFTNNADIANLYRSIRDHGSEGRYNHTRIGINGRLNSFQCAFLLERLERYDEDIKNRNKIAQIYLNQLSNLPSNKLIVPFVKPDKTSVWAQFTIRTSERNHLQSFLSEQGIPTAIHYDRVLPDQPVYKNNMAISRSSKIENAQKAAQEVLSLPLYPHMSEDDAKMVTEKITAFFQ